MRCFYGVGSTKESGLHELLSMLACWWTSVVIKIPMHVAACGPGNGKERKFNKTLRPTSPRCWRLERKRGTILENVLNSCRVRVENCSAGRTRCRLLRRRQRCPTLLRLLQTRCRCRQLLVSTVPSLPPPLPYKPRHVAFCRRRWTNIAGTQPVCVASDFSARRRLLSTTSEIAARKKRYACRWSASCGLMRATSSWFA